MKKIYSFFALLLTSLIVGAQTFTVTTEGLAPQSWWPVLVNEQEVIINCPQTTAQLESKGAVRTTGTFIEALAQANLGNIKKIVFDPSVSTISFVGRTQVITNLCANGVSIKADHPVTIIGFDNASFKTITITGTNDTIMGLTFQDAYIELNGTSAYIANNTFTTNQKIGGIFLFNTSSNKIVNNTLTKSGGTTNNSAIRIGTNQSETVWGNTSNDTIINNIATGYWNGLEVGRWNNTAPNCNNLYIKGNSMYINKNTGIYLTASASSTIDSNFIYGNVGGGLVIDNCTSNLVYRNKVGLNKLNQVAGNSSDGIAVIKGSGHYIGDNGKGNIIVGNGNAGPSLTDGNLAKGHGIFLSASKNNFIKGNIIGTDSTTRLKKDVNSNDYGNQLSGIYIENIGTPITDNNTIGGSNLGDGNIIGNNGFAHIPYLTTAPYYGPRSGIQLYNSNGNTVIGNISGTNSFADNIGNRQEALTLNGSSSNTIGGSGLSKNIFAFTTNGSGISLREGFKAPGQVNNSSNNIIKGNYIGTSNGINSLPNAQFGLTLEIASSNNTIGGTLVADSNIIINNPTGIWVAGSPVSTGNTIKGNRISNNTANGILIANATTTLTISNNLIKLNDIGIAYTGTATNGTVSNNTITNSTSNGISIAAAITNTTFTNNTITNTTNGNGINVSAAASNLTIRTNTITDNKYIGAGLQPTKGNGIYMTSGNTSIIGGTGVDEGNIITNNQTDGISLSGVATNNVMLRRNKIACNQGTGINLNGNANTNYMFDIIRVDTSASDVNSITGLLKGITIKDVIVEVFGPGATCKQSCNTDIGRQGYEYLGTTTTDAAGKWTLTLASPILLSDVTQITATATTPSALNVAGSFVTSEFSRCNDALPVEFISFTAKSVQNGVALNWITATETNNDYFLIERSTDGINFTAIGSPVNGAGTSNQTHVYKYLDSDPNEGINYYRIRQVDYDGKFDFSNVQVVNLTGAQMISVSPNPNNGHFGIKIISESAELFNISIYNALGQSIYTTSLNVYGGYAEHKVNLDKFASGVYTLVIKNDVDTWTEKVIKE